MAGLVQEGGGCPSLCADGGGGPYWRIEFECYASRKPEGIPSDPTMALQKQRAPVGAL